MIMTKNNKKKVMLIPYPAQGHVTPMLKLASVLSNFGLKPVIITPEYIHRRISSQINGQDQGIVCMSIPDGLDEETPRDFFAIEKAMEETMPNHLHQLVQKMNEEEEEEDGGGIACLVVDILAAWAVEVAAHHGVPVAGFWPAMHATYRLIAAIPQLIRTGVISENGCPINQSNHIRLSCDEPTLSASCDLPWLIGSSTARTSRFKFWTRTLQRSKNLIWILTNTFPDEHYQSKPPQHDPGQKSQQILEIGPLLMQTSTIGRGSFWNEDPSCLDWLDQQDMGCVVYVSFGSWVSPIGEAKVKCLALALEASCRPFIWVLGPAWRRGLPDGYVERVGTRGKVVSWSPQMQILQHPAVGCNITHCGWNSTMEAIQCKKPLLCYPVAGDQFLNCRYIVNVWKIGVKIEGFGAKEVIDGMRKVVEDEQMRQRIERLNEKLFGKKGTFKAMDNLSTFLQDLDN